MKQCRIDGCNNKYHAKGFCGTHYDRYRKYGNPLFTKTERHGMKNTTEYTIWKGLKQRCLNPNDPDYKYYGGRGITVCDRWLYSFKTFYADMGNKPFPKAQIDRKDTNGDYSPGNCRWVTEAVNAQNRRSTILNWFTVRSIRRLHSLNKYSLRELSLIYKVKKNLISLVTNNRIWIEVI